MDVLHENVGHFYFYRKLLIIVEHKVLIVDDVAINRKLLSSFIKNYFNKNVIIFQASNGLEAIDIFNKEIIDIIFMDIHMPNMNGIEAIKHIRKIEDGKRVTPIILTTAEEHVKIKDNNIMYFLKPIEYIELEQILDNLFERSL